MYTINDCSTHGSVEKLGPARHFILFIGKSFDPSSEERLNKFEKNNAERYMERQVRNNKESVSVQVKGMFER